MTAVRAPFTVLGAVTPCPGGWLALSARVVGSAVAVDQVEVLASLAEVIDLRPAFAVAAIDVPIGLHDEPSGPFRACDREARAMLGWPRAHAVRPVPSRRALGARSFDEARAAEPWLRHFDWDRMTRLREADEVFRAFHQRRWFSALPDLGFAALNAGIPVVASPYQAAGVMARLGLLRQQLPGVEQVVLDTPPAGAGMVHVLRALGLVWTARRIHGRRAVRLPVDPVRDSIGRRIELLW